MNRVRINFFSPFVLIIFLIIVIGITFSVIKGKDVSCGINGMTEMRCIKGYQFVIGQDGSTRQVLDEFGKGAKCD